MYALLFAFPRVTIGVDCEGQTCVSITTVSPTFPVLCKRIVPVLHTSWLWNSRYRVLLMLGVQVPLQRQVSKHFFFFLEKRCNTAHHCCWIAKSSCRMLSCIYPNTQTGSICWSITRVGREEIQYICCKIPDLGQRSPTFQSQSTGSRLRAARFSLHRTSGEIFAWQAWPKLFPPALPGCRRQTFPCPAHQPPNLDRHLPRCLSLSR